MPYPGLHAFPTDPIPAVRCLLSYFRDEVKPETVEVGHAAWHLVGYGYSMVDTHPSFSASPARPMTQAEFVRQLEVIEAQHQAGGFSAAGFDWLSLVAMILKLLEILRP